MFQKTKALKHPPFPPDVKMSKDVDYIYTVGRVDDLLELDVYSVKASLTDGAALLCRIFIRQDGALRTWDARRCAWTSADLTDLTDAYMSSVLCLNEKRGRISDASLESASTFFSCKNEYHIVMWHVRDLFQIARNARYEARVARENAKHAREVDILLCATPKMPSGFRRWCERVLMRDRQYLFAEPNAQTGICSCCGAVVPVMQAGQRTNRCPACGIPLRAAKQGALKFNKAEVSIVQRAIGLEDTLIVREVGITQTSKGGRFETAAIERRRRFIPAHGMDQVISQEDYSRFKYKGWDLLKPAPFRKTILCPLGVKAAIAGKAWQYCALLELGRGADGRFERRYIARYLETYRHNPELEKLVKVGLKRLVSDTPYCLSEGKRLQDMLGVNRADLRALAAMDASERELNLLEAMRREKQRFTYEDLRALGRMKINSYALRELAQFRISPGQVQKYLQAQKQKQGKQAYSAIAQLWIDALRFARELGADVSKKSIRFPDDLQRTHDRLATRKKVVKNERYNAGIRARAAALADMSYKGKDYLIRPVSCIRELIAEGERLHHCVGGYGERISDGKCMIFLLRRTDAPEEPFVTVEIRADGSIGQTSAAYNKPPKGDVMSFIRAWHARRFTTEDKPAKAG